VNEGDAVGQAATRNSRRMDEFEACGRLCTMLASGNCLLERYEGAFFFTRSYLPHCSHIGTDWYLPVESSNARKSATMSAGSC